MNRYILVGMSGAGKTTMGEKVSETEGLLFLDLDVEIEKKYGSISGIFENYGESRFRELETMELKSAVEKDNVIISTGGGIVEQKENRQLLKKGTVIYIDRNIGNIEKTLDDENRPMVRGKPGMLSVLLDMREPMYREVMDYIVSNDGEPATCAESISEIIRRAKK